MQYILRQLLNNNKIMKLLVILINYLIFILTFISCNTFNKEEIVYKAEEVLAIKGKELYEIVYLSPKVAEKPCKVYKILTSSTTDIFLFQEYTFDKESNMNISGSVLDISSTYKELITNILPKKYVTEFLFMKDLYVSFSLRHVRDKQRKYCKLLYFKNKSISNKLFPKYKFYNKTELNKINDNENWVCFINENWAVTTSNDVCPLSVKECEIVIDEMTKH